MTVAEPRPSQVSIQLALALTTRETTITTTRTMAVTVERLMTFFLAGAVISDYSPFFFLGAYCAANFFCFSRKSAL